MTAASMDDFARYCCGDADCSNDCERETPPLTSEDYRRAANDMAEKLPDDSPAAWRQR